MKFLVSCFLLGLLFVAPEASALNCGDVMTTIDGVPAYYNGQYQGTVSSCGGTRDGNYLYQCVELVDRFHGRSDWKGNGDDYFGSVTEKGLDAYTNGVDAEFPLHGDLLGFSGGGAGHIALVDKVTCIGDRSYQVEIVEQNWPGTSGRRQLAMERRSDNTLFIDSGSSGYTVQGWMRYPAYFNPAILSAVIEEFNGNGGAAKFGTLQQDTHWYHAYNAGNLYRSGNVSNNCYVKNYAGGAYANCGIVFDELGGASRAYTVRTGFWENSQWKNGWSQPQQPGQGGPMSVLGMPMTDEYETDPGYVARQDFMLGWLNYNSIGSVVTVHTYSKCAPGWTASGWNTSVSYQLAALYETGGAWNHYGEATDVAYLDGETWRQQFTSGSIELPPDDGIVNGQGGPEGPTLTPFFGDWKVIHMYIPFPHAILLYTSKYLFFEN